MPMPKMNPKAQFAIIIPTFNRLVFTQLCFKALLKYTNFKLVRMIKIYDNYSTDGTFEYVKSLGLDVTQGYYINSNFCINEFASHYKDSEVKYLVKIDNDRVFKYNWLGISQNFLRRNPNTGTLYICKRVGPYYPSHSNHHGGVFITLFDLIKKYGPFRTNGMYPGCHFYNDFVVSQGFFRYAIPKIGVDISHLPKYTALVQEYASKNYMRIRG